MYVCCHGVYAHVYVCVYVCSIFLGFCVSSYSFFEVRCDVMLLVVLLVRCFENASVDECVLCECARNVVVYMRALCVSVEVRNS